MSTPRRASKRRDGNRSTNSGQCVSATTPRRVIWKDSRVRRRHGGKPHRPLPPLANSRGGKAGGMRAACVGAGVQRAYGRGCERMGLVLVQVQVDVREREPG